ncbi:MAG: ribonuclease R [Clostridia bacterium]|nr:ribonuclease R [Clostridia bacterium]
MGRRSKVFFEKKKRMKKASYNKSKIRKPQIYREPTEEVDIGRIAGLFRRSKNFGFVIPDSRKVPMDIYIPQKCFNGAKDNQKVIVEITKQATKNRKLEGKIIEVVGDENEAGIDMLTLIKQYDVPYEFPKAAMVEVQHLDNNVIMDNRVDLRNEEIFTIDGEDAKDLDDAVSVYENEDGTYTLNVHIADVSNYVKDGSKLNKEAIRRGTSIYMLDRVIPMLPKEISNGICSLNEGEDRYTLSISMNIDKKGKVTSSKIYKAVINVTKRMNYTDVYKIISKSDKEVLKKYKPYVKHFERMAKLAKILEKRRISNGYLDLEIPESKITLDEDGKPTNVERYETNEAHKIIEEFMLTANEAIAETFEKLKAPFIYRTHEMPDIEKVEELNKFLFDLGYKIKVNKNEVKPKNFQEVLNEIKNKPEEKVISTLILRTLKQAKYESQNKGHFGIASKYYCHFTSPIRRYPDLFIHRVISEYIGKNYEIEESLKGKWQKQAVNYAEISSERERNAVMIERDAQDIKKAEYMESKIGETYTGIISGVTSFGIFVELENTIEGFIRFENLGNDYYIYDEEKKTIIGERTKETFRIGDQMTVKVIEANKNQRRISFAKENLCNS